MYGYPVSGVGIDGTSGCGLMATGGKTFLAIPYISVG